MRLFRSVETERYYTALRSDLFDMPPTGFSPWVKQYAQEIPAHLLSDETALR